MDSCHGKLLHSYCSIDEDVSPLRPNSRQRMRILSVSLGKFERSQSIERSIKAQITSKSTSRDAFMLKNIDPVIQLDDAKGNIQHLLAETLIMWQEETITQ